MPLLKVVIPLCLGIALSKSFPQQSLYTRDFLVLAALGLSLSAIFIKRRSTLKSYCILSLFVLIGYLHQHFSSIDYHYNHFSVYNGATYYVLSPENSKQIDGNVRAQCRVLYAGITQDSLIKTSGKCMVYLKDMNLEDMQSGDVIITNAEFRREKKNTNPEVFDYQAFLHNRGIYHSMFCTKPSYQLLENKKIDIWDQARRYQNLCQGILSHHIKKKNNLAVISAMVLGERNLLSDELYDAFTDTGSVHILAVSGLHVGIVSALIAICLMFLSNSNKYSRVLKFILSIAAVWGFALLTGAAAAVTRAAIMFSLYFFAKSIGRKGISFNVLSLAALLMLLYSPSFLFQAGFQFSFLALAGIMFFYKRIRNLIKTKYRIINGIWNLMAMSFAAQLLVSPLAIFYFHKLPLYFWLTGVFAVPFAGILLSAGLILLLSHLVLGAEAILTKLIAFCLEHLLSFFNSVIFQSQKLPYCSADGLWISETSIFIIYCAMLVGMLFLAHRKVKYLYICLTLLIAQSVNHNLENWIIKREKEFVVYDIYSDSVSHIFFQGKLLSINPGINSPRQVDYITQNNVLAQRVYKEITAEEVGSKIVEGFYSLDGYLFLFYPSESILDFECKEPIDFLVLSEHSFTDIRKLAKRFEINQIIIDGTVKKYKTAITRAAYELGIPIHFTTNHGAFEVIL